MITKIKNYTYILFIVYYTYYHFHFTNQAFIDI